MVSGYLPLPILWVTQGFGAKTKTLMPCLLNFKGLSACVTLERFRHASPTQRARTLAMGRLARLRIFSSCLRASFLTGLFLAQSWLLLMVIESFCVAPWAMQFCGHLIFVIFRFVVSPTSLGAFGSMIQPSPNLTFERDCPEAGSHSIQR